MSSNHKPSVKPQFARDVIPGTVVAQFAFAPATQTTIVTTTTTTTTKFPPLMIRPPRRPYELDEKLFPLASARTPVNLRNISFVVDGKTATFREAEDTSLAIQETQDEYDSLEKSNGMVQSVQNFEPRTLQDSQYSSNPFLSQAAETRPRPVSPESITEYESESGISSNQPKNGKLRHRPAPSAITKKLPSLRRTLAQNPITPSSGAKDLRLARAQSFGDVHDSPGLGHPGSSLRGRGPSLPAAEDLHESHLEEDEPVVPTPPVEPNEQRSNSRPPSRRIAPPLPSRLNLIETPGQDGSLPSPSLSPITAGLSAPHAEYFADVDSVSECASQNGHESWQSGSYGRTPSRSRFVSPLAQEIEEKGYTRPSGSTINDINSMLDTFDAIPDELKSYVMHQLLRRCPKTTLQVVADAVNPALKCDFLTSLPTELGLNILKFLDVRSLCKASQVSKKWRQMINGDEKAWKHLFDIDGLSMPEGELKRAITEGWGWQDPSGLTGYEIDLSISGAFPSDSEGILSSASATFDHARKSVTGGLRRSKRKAQSTLSNPSKQRKRRGAPRSSSVDMDSVDWMEQMKTAEGPYNAANAAIMAVPHPKLALPSLKGLHLYKSLYRRHHLIRRNWMHEDTPPHHIAFRAHDRHVVTCLQFDTNKIVTGSDDNNINVYNTKTGALKAKLEGHEGGVWALQYEGNTLVSGSTDRSVRVWDIEQGIETQVFRGHTSTVRCLQIVPPVKVGETAEGKDIMMPRYPLIITGSRDSTLRIWRLPQPGDKVYIQPENAADDSECPYFLRTLIGHGHSVRAIAAHADTLVSGSYDSTIRVWKISTGETQWELQGHSAKVYSVVLDVERNRCISGSMDNMVKIWSLDTGSLVHTLDGHSSLVGLLDLNSERLVSAAADSTLRIWDPENGQCKATLSAHTGAITCFQHDAQKVISGSDRTLKMWNVKSGECIKDLLSDLSGVWQVKFNERRCVAAVQRDNMTYIEVLDYGAARDGVPESRRGRRIVVDSRGLEIVNEESGYLDLDGNADA